jgi:glyoxylase-like metal-dependent hydrolase (beta-lactamase superfamily II)
MLQRDAAPGIHRIEDAYTNWYLVEHEGALTIVDAGVPTSWESFEHALGTLGRQREDVQALVLTHGHFDHIGFAERARRELGVPVWVHENDVLLTKRPLNYGRERNPLEYIATHPKALPIVGQLLMARAFWPSPIGEVRRYREGPLDVPGSPHVLLTPGHTLGHLSLHFPDRDAVIAGDAIVTLNPYTGGTGPQLVARAATADSERALASLDVLAETGAQTLLTGHGEPWTRGVADAVEQAKRVGVT